MMKPITASNVGCLIMNVTLGRDGKHFQRRQEFLIRNSGPEHAIKRAKAIYNAAILLRNGDHDQARELYQKNSIAYHHDTLLPKGIEGRVVARFVQRRKPSVVKRITAALRWYTSITLTELTKGQRAKALNAIGSPSKAIMDDDQIYDRGYMYTQLALQLNAVRHKLGVANGCYTKTSCSNVGERLLSKTYYADNLKGTSKYYSRYSVPTEMKSSPYSSMTLSMMTEPWLPKSIDSRTPCFEMRERIKELYPHLGDQQFAGKISFLQEQGGKARVVAQPSGWLQLAFVPLHKTLANIAEGMFPESSCVNDQVKGADNILRMFTNDVPLYCTDLSSATDRFPLRFSLGVLDALGLQEWSTALQEVVSKPFYCPESPDGHIKYAVGQPMGLYSSFPLFHLSNMIVAQRSCYEAWHYEERKKNPHFPRFGSPKAAEYYISSCLRKDKEGKTIGGVTEFLTLGDDIIFSSSSGQDCYRSLLTQFGVDISEHKSFTGFTAEFAGFMAFKQGPSAVIFRPYKVPDKSYISNPLDFLASVGSGLKNSKLKRSTYWQKQYEKFLYTLPHRDLSNAPFDYVVGDDIGCAGSTYRGDTHVIMNIANALSMTMEEPLPDLNEVGAVSSKPLFLEQRQFDFYGFNPDAYQKEQTNAQFSLRRVPQRRLSMDPLMSMSLDRIQGLTPKLETAEAEKSIVPVTYEKSDLISDQRPNISTRSPRNGQTDASDVKSTKDKVLTKAEALAQLQSLYTEDETQEDDYSFLF